ncbi:hypothetical protein VNO80_09243 [Phaseolus coccineus]|uniref:Uncharacterized protein n=1 Tax=Phaseolus coccineus TaxID=3886 RepID=A0AAN9RDI2_PHACN
MYSCSGSVLFCLYLLVCRPGYLAIIKLTIAVAVEHQRKYSIHLIACTGGAASLISCWALASLHLNTLKGLNMKWYTTLCHVKQPVAVSKATNGSFGNLEKKNRVLHLKEKRLLQRANVTVGPRSNF